MELIRRREGKAAYGLTLSLLTKSDGKKMGKTASGALWLDAGKTSPYDFYQYWRNIDDGDVEKCLARLTFLPMDEVHRLTEHRDERMNDAKKILAYEVTRLVHGESEAEKAKAAAEALFGGAGDSSSMPTAEVAVTELGTRLVDILAKKAVIASKGEGKRLVQQNGLSLNDERITDIERTLMEQDFKNGVAIVRKGKKTYVRLTLVQ